MINQWSVYILRCVDGSFYTGITNNIKRRLEEHNNSKTVGSKYVRARRPVVLVYKQQTESRSEALKKEQEIKKLSRILKIALIGGPVAQR
ncbi:GIY-YIG nuclease family protein [Candidatus Gottesmanbacteria bacterium]|nr:GIY-YIG nuclease family protein [Candidatus Gottesmanbacteria bacterium]